jgi:nucleotide-binding universal stress UspA family protein
MSGGTIRTIAVHLPTAELSKRLLDVAVPLAQERDALLIGVHVVPTVVVFADSTVSMSGDFILAQQETFREEADAIRQIFHDRVEAGGIGSAWSEADPAGEPTMRAAASCCNTADLVIATQDDASIPAAAGYGPDELVLGTGRPVLIVPIRGAPKPLGQRVLVGWNGSREAARATFDLLPLLRPEAEVRLVAVDSSRGNGSIQAAARALSRHGVRTEAIKTSRAEGRNVAEEILQAASAWEADPLALGCYGHSRLRETVFGGATKRILRDMALPVLMAH